MQISNFSELISARLQNSPKNLRLTSFCARLSSVIAGSAFFTDSLEEANLAIEQGAYAIVSQKKLNLFDKEVALLRVDDFTHSMLRLILFFSINKRAFILNELEIECLKRLNITTLSNDLFEDFEIILKNDLLFSSQGSYLESLCITINEAKFSYELIKRSSFFYQDLILNDEYHYNVFIPAIFTEALAKIHSIKELEISLTNLKLLDYIFLNDNNDIVKMNEASKVVFFENSEIIINEIKKYLNLIAVDEVKNHTYMLSTINKNDFLNTLKKPDEGLF